MTDPGDDLRDYVGEEDEPYGPYRIVQKVDTPFQRIAVVETDTGTLIFGNGYIMFGTSEDDTAYGESLIHVPMSLAVRRERILIVGGGGGITTREVLKYPEVTAVTVVDIDPQMMEFGKSLPALVKFNQNALSDPRVTTVIMDGRTYIAQSTATWDVIIIDLPEPTPQAPDLRLLFSREFYGLLAQHLAPGGVIGVACAVPSQMPAYFWSVEATLKAAGLHTLPYRFDGMVEWEQDWGFCAAASRPLSPADVKIPVPTQFLPPEQVEELFQIPFRIRQRKPQAQVQTDTNRVMEQMNTYD